MSSMHRWIRRGHASFCSQQSLAKWCVQRSMRVLAVRSYSSIAAMARTSSTVASISKSTGQGVSCSPSACRWYSPEITRATTRTQAGWNTILDGIQALELDQHLVGNAVNLRAPTSTCLRVPVCELKASAQYGGVQRKPAANLFQPPSV